MEGPVSVNEPEILPCVEYLLGLIPKLGGSVGPNRRPDPGRGLGP